MELVRFIIEYNGKVILNNEFSTVVSTREPLIIDWFTDNDLIIETHEKIIINTARLDESPCRVIQINTNTFIVRPSVQAKETELTVIGEETVFIALKSYTVELARGGGTTYMTVANKTDASALNLRCNIEEYKVETDSGRIVLKGRFAGGKVRVSFDPENNSVVHHSVAYNSTEPQFAFLQSLCMKEYESAKGLLAFDISDEQLHKYFGDFEILVNNYLQSDGTVSIIPYARENFIASKNFTFEIESGKIQNIV